mmetsp:Transcript_9731/g.29076  ORF Transcript_9731/g.29076 Transcript_9731/m.29076 type:complete len:119 (-) Transcript_9731:468-824(-)
MFLAIEGPHQPQPPVLIERCRLSMGLIPVPGRGAGEEAFDAPAAREARVARPGHSNIARCASVLRTMRRLLFFSLAHIRTRLGVHRKEPTFVAKGRGGGASSRRRVPKKTGRHALLRK